MLATVFSFGVVGLAILYAAALFSLRAGFRKLSEEAGKKERSSSPQDLPSVSVVVSARNEAHNLPRLISCLINQDYPRGKLEVLIVDDRSEDATWEILEAASKEHRFLKALRITDVLPDFAPKKRVLDLAIRSARGEIILLTDADCTPPPTWARSMMEFYRDGVAGIVGYSPYRFDRPMPALLKGMLALDYFSLFAVAAASVGLGRSLTASGTNLSYRKQTYLAVGGFEKIKQWISGDDDLFVHEVTRRNLGRFSFALDPRAYVPAAAPTSWRQFWHQRIRYASKGRHYGPAMTLGLMAVYLLNVLIVLGVSSFLFHVSTFSWLALAAWGVKMAIEYLFLGEAASAFNEKRLMRYFIPTALVHPLYISVFGFLGIFGNFRWKQEGFKAKVSPR